MKKKLFFVTLAVLAAIATGALAQVKTFVPVTQAMLLNPSPDDWLMYSRTYDAQRFSPLNQINKGNVSKLALVWKNDLATGTIEIIPLVHNGVMYVEVPVQDNGMSRVAVQALDATNGNLIWEYRRPTGNAARPKTLAIFEDIVIFAAPDNVIVGLDAATGKVRWEEKTTRGLSSGTVVFGDKVITGGTCNGGLRANCFIAANDARTGKEVWRFYTAAGSDDAIGDASWGGAPEEKRTASTWGLGGSYDPVRKMVYWGVANPTPNTRAVRHGGNPEAISKSAPSDLYSNSTLALNLETGKLSWYYQHLPGDDWDQDYTNERILIRTRISPDPKFVKWINPDIKKGEEHDIAVNIGEGGGMWALDRQTGQFLWANPFPYAEPNFLISDIDVKTGRTTINWDLVMKTPGEHHVICAYNTKSYWPMAYNPPRNSFYIPYVDDCLDMTSAVPAPPVAAATTAGQRGQAAAPPADGAARGRGRGPSDGSQPERRQGVRRPGSDPEKFGGIAKVNASTGEIVRFYEGSVPGDGATLTTAGDLVFWGDLNQQLRAFDADTGKVLWQTTVPGPIQTSTITYRVNGKQYIAVVTGMGAVTASIFPRAGVTGINPQRNNSINVFALPN